MLPSLSPVGCRHRARLPLLFVALVGAVMLPAPAAAVDSLVVGQDIRLLGWRNIADWGQVERVTVTFDSLFKWDVSPRANLAPGTLARGGRIFATYETVEEDSVIEVTGPLPGLENVIDGDGATAFDPDRAGQSGVPRALRIVIDLGAAFSVDRVRLHPRLDDAHRIRFPQQFIVSTSASAVSDGPYTPISRLNFSAILPNAEPVVDRVFAPRPARFVQLRTDAVAPWELAEIEIYSDGTVPVGQFQSIPLPARQAFPVWGRVRYEGGDIEELPVVMQVRTGPDRSPIQYFRYTGVGDDLEEVAAGIYNALPEEEQGPVRPNPDWTSWSTVSGSLVRSTALNRYLQFRLRFSEPGTIIRRLIFEYSQPALLTRLQGEVSPRLATPGRETAFTLSLLAHTASRSRAAVTGFRRFEVRTAAEVIAVDGVLVDDVEVPYAASLRPGEGFSINLGRRVEQDGTFLQVRFRARIFRDATRFEPRVVDRRFSDGRLESVYQVADAGDVDRDTPGGELVVRVDTGDLGVLGNLGLDRAVVTPNGDGVNDVARLAFDLFKVTRPVTVTVAVYDLGGRLVARLLRDELRGGRHDVTWDARDAAGHRVPPGTYLYRVRVRVDGDDITRQGVVGVAY